jgi:hypothetical protein
VLLDDLEYPDIYVRERFADMRARASQTIRILKTTELASLQELGQYERLLVASALASTSSRTGRAPRTPPWTR